MKFFFNGGSYMELTHTLREMGHTVLDHDAVWLHHINDKDRGKAYNQLLKKAIADTKPDVYLATKGLKNSFRIYPETHEWIRKNVGITIYWSQDDPFFMPTFLREKLYSGYQIGLTCSSSAFAAYRSVGMKPYLFWPAFDSIYRKFSPVEEKDKVDFVFVGTPYLCTNVPRKQTVFGLMRVGITDIELYGSNAWISDKIHRGRGGDFIGGDHRLKKYYKGTVSWGEVHKLYAKARLNLSNHVMRADDYLNDRVPMVLGVGGFLFLDKNPGLEKKFTHGKEVIFYSGHDDLLRKAEYYIARPDERERIGNNGRKKALKFHTYANRARQLLKILNENGFECEWYR